MAGIIKKRVCDAKWSSTVWDVGAGDVKRTRSVSLIFGDSTMKLICTLVVGAMATQATAQSVRGWGQSGLINADQIQDNITQFAPAAVHEVALLRDGTLAYWGWTRRGTANIPAGLNDVVKVASGSQHVMALRMNGTVICWGTNWSGELVPPSNLTALSDIAAGGFGFSLALQQDGVVRSWGLGTLSPADDSHGLGSVPADLTTCSAIAAGGSHALAIQSNGIVRAWGSNSYGQTAVPPKLGTCTAIAGGYSHTLALRLDGLVHAWGAGVTTGGDPHHGQSVVPAGLGPCTAILVGFLVTSAVKDLPAYWARLAALVGGGA